MYCSYSLLNTTALKISQILDWFNKSISTYNWLKTSELTTNLSSQLVLKSNFTIEKKNAFLLTIVFYVAFNITNYTTYIFIEAQIVTWTCFIDIWPLQYLDKQWIHCWIIWTISRWILIARIKKTTLERNNPDRENKHLGNGLLGRWCVFK